MKHTKLFLADDHQILIDGLIAFFNSEDHIEVCGHANDGIAMLRALHSLQPDLVILDLNMPKLDGVKTLERMAVEYPNIQVIVLSNYNQSQLIREVRAKGAKGYLLKNGSKAELLEAIETVRNDGTYFQVAEEQEQPENSIPADMFKLRYQLTKRELEIITLICKGASTPELSEKLFISENTVNTHRRNIMYKLDVKNVAGLIGFARENGII
ncbi:MAG: response regulator transcription factor [Proteobacteria bacterium]|nr:MAG: response regulator transcription factor [Pseudomonadota bacterium]